MYGIHPLNDTATDYSSDTKYRGCYVHRFLSSDRFLMLQFGLPEASNAILALTRFLSVMVGSLNFLAPLAHSYRESVTEVIVYQGTLYLGGLPQERRQSVVESL